MTRFLYSRSSVPPHPFLPPDHPLTPQMNTHYAIAAIYALGLRGIRKQIAVTAKPYGQPGSTYAELPKLPTSLESATALFKRKDSLAREVFGDFFVDHFAGTREHECEVHRRAVTAWEGESALLLLPSAPGNLTCMYGGSKVVSSSQRDGAWSLGSALALLQDTE